MLGGKWLGLCCMSGYSVEDMLGLLGYHRLPRVRTIGPKVGPPVGPPVETLEFRVRTAGQRSDRQGAGGPLTPDSTCDVVTSSSAY